MAAAGDVVSDYASVASNGLMTIQPTGTEQWMIHTIFSEPGVAIEVQMTDGTPKTIDALSGGSVHGLTWRVTNAKYLLIKNMNAGAKYIGYQGVISRL